MFWKLTYQDFNIRLVEVYNMKIMASLQAFPIQPPHPSPPPFAFLSRPSGMEHCIDKACLKVESLR